ncbi:bifunctional protein-serine/threonine kinase/phosphatase [Marinimicrobium agarilyticum]|uniref:bifunctional protein-serine/threonine kinase/phosphatase n=1 Tax=Marinimicrobium agarilyticum TaxID=306546 RepID=UPI00042223D3|nr:bifunctional protein-serine/threonine kinase/phosphatase [Marinimicrobium agarilyticum]
MTDSLTVRLGQYTHRGRKALNQDFHGAYLPKEPHRTTKGIVVALADGISSSDVSQIASESAISSFLADYYCTSETWSVKQAAQRVLMATNSWLYAQTRQSQYRYDMDRGYVCTFSALILKSTTAHVFHIGDTRIYRVSGGRLEQLTEDHRLWVSKEVSYLSRALGINHHLEMDYQTLALEKGDTFLLASDGVYEFVSEQAVLNTLTECDGDLDEAAKRIGEQAYENGSDDNITAQLVRVDGVPGGDQSEMVRDLKHLPFPPSLSARMTFEGFLILRQLHASSRSHVYLVKDLETEQSLVLKTLATDLQQDDAHQERFLMEEWIARRIDSPHVLKPCLPNRARQHLYTVTEYIEGQTLQQWSRDNPSPSLPQVRDLVAQIAKGLRAFHRLEMLHQDLRPANVMIDDSGTVKIIDFGSTRVAGLAELKTQTNEILGTAAYTAPEYFVGEPPTPRADQFSLAVLAYQLLTGELPYGTQVAKARTRADQHKLRYQSALTHNPALPLWVDETLKRALSVDPFKRYDALSEFVYDLEHPNPRYVQKTQPPLLERDPVLFWKGISLILALVSLSLAVELFG